MDFNHIHMAAAVNHVDFSNISEGAELFRNDAPGESCPFFLVNSSQQAGLDELKSALIQSSYLKQLELLSLVLLLHPAINSKCNSTGTHPQFLAPYPHVSLFDYVVEVRSHGERKRGSLLPEAEHSMKWSLFGGVTGWRQLLCVTP